MDNKNCVVVVVELAASNIKQNPLLKQLKSVI